MLDVPDQLGPLLAGYVADILAILGPDVQRDLDPGPGDGGEKLIIRGLIIFQLLFVLVGHHRPDPPAAAKVDQIGKLATRQLVKFIHDQTPVFLVLLDDVAPLQALGSRQGDDQVAHIDRVGVADILPKITHHELAGVEPFPDRQRRLVLAHHPLQFGRIGEAVDAGQGRFDLPRLVVRAFIRRVETLPVLLQLRGDAMVAHDLLAPLGVGQHLIQIEQRATRLADGQADAVLQVLLDLRHDRFQRPQALEEGHDGGDDVRVRPVGSVGISMLELEDVQAPVMRLTVPEAESGGDVDNILVGAVVAGDDLLR